MKCEFRGEIMLVRAVEDSIRATRKYTKGAFSRPSKHPMQGEDFPSRLLTEFYEVYPDLEVGWDMSIKDAFSWLWGDVTYIDVRFQYDYRTNHAVVIVGGGTKAVQELSDGIPGFRDSLMRMSAAEAFPTPTTEQLCRWGKVV